MPSSVADTSPLTLNRLSVYLRCLRALAAEGVKTVSSQELGERFNLSSAQIRKDLAQFGDFGVRGVGYEVEPLAAALHELLGLSDQHRLVICGMGHLGRALAGYLGFNDLSFSVVAAVDSDPEKVGQELAGLVVRPTGDLRQVVLETHADIGVIAVPSDAAVPIYEDLVAAGVSSILNFAPTSLPESATVRVKNVDMRIYLEEMAFFLKKS